MISGRLYRLRQHHRAPSGVYRPIGDYAFLSDQSAPALLSRDGSVDWMCAPRFESAPFFCRILDSRHGGTFRVGPLGSFIAERGYLPGTNVMSTTYECSGGTVRVTDLLSTAGGPGTLEWKNLGGTRMLRRIEGLSGEAELEVWFHPTFDFARHATHLTPTGFGVVARSRRDWLTLQSPAPLHPDDRGGVRAVFKVRAGQTLWVRMVFGSGPLPLDVRRSDSHCEAELQKTVQFWLNRTQACSYDGPYRELVLRSALALGGMIYAQTGAMVAAPTIGLPEDIGAPRNFDYRYCWIRDSALSVRALLMLGYTDDARRLLRWLLDKLADRREPDHDVALTVLGEAPPRMRPVRGLEGYEGSTPVRLGFATQPELDDYGEMLDAAALLPSAVSRRHWKVLRAYANYAARRWQQPDRSIWEFPGPKKQYLFSKVMCWVAVDRAIRIARNQQLPAPLHRWRRERDRIRHLVLSRGWDPLEGAFTQVLGEPGMDASLLAIPLSGFLPATDPRMRQTIRRTRERLGVGPLLYRYLTDDQQPGLGSGFVLCSFWLSDCLLMTGDLDGARAVFEGTVAHANDLGLLSEEIDMESGQLRGNFPQALSHLALVRSAYLIGEAERKGMDVFRARSPYARLSLDPEHVRTEPSLP